MKIMVVILSRDYSLKTHISNDLVQMGNYNVVADLYDAVQAAGHFVKNAPNVLIVDSETITVTPVYLKSIIEKNHLQVIILGTANSAVFLRSGIRDVLTKPVSNNSFSMNVFMRSLVSKIDSFAKDIPVMTNSNLAGTVDEHQKVIAIAASTGGTEALPVVLYKLPADCPPVLIVQHMPSMFTNQFANRLDKLAKISIKEAANNDYLKKGLALIAPGDYHMRMVKRNAKLIVECFQSEKMHGVRPAADILFNSMAGMAPNVIGVILTGMGSDGAKGLYELKLKGATVIGQDKESSVVYGMPKAAYDLGAVHYQLPLDRIADKIMSLV